MDTFFEIVAMVFGGIVFVAGAALLVFGLKTMFGERKNCTLSTVGIVKEKIYDYSSSWNDPTGNHGGTYPCGLRMLITIDDDEHNVFNETYDTSYERFNEGDVVRIKVNPDNPSEYYVNEGASPGLNLILFGAGMMIAGVFLIKYFRF